MVKDSGTKVRPHRLRPLAGPRPLHVAVDDHGLPRSIVFEGSDRAVITIQDRWRVDDEWWREAPISRMYYELRLDGDRVITVYEDMTGGAWWLQRY